MQSTLGKRLETAVDTEPSGLVVENASFAERRVRQQTYLFEQARRLIIYPRMQEIAQFLGERFINTRITTDERRYENTGRLIGSIGITLRTFVNSSPSDNIGNIPHYAIYWEPLNLVARFYRNMNATRMSGDLTLDGRAALHEITSDLIESKLQRFAESIA